MQVAQEKRLRVMKMTGQEMGKDKITSFVRKAGLCNFKSSLKCILSSLCEKKAFLLAVV